MNSQNFDPKAEYEKQLVNMEQAAKELRKNPVQLVEGDRLENNQNGHVYAANATRFNETYFQQPLTDYALGWFNQNPEVAATLEFAAPRVQVPHKFEYAYGTFVEGLLSETDDVRAIGADFKRVSYTSNKATSRTYNKGLTVRVDMDEVEGMPNWEQVYTQRLMKRLMLNDLRRAIVLLLAAGSNTAKTWDTTAGVSPDQDVIARLVVGAASLGNIGLNRVLYGTTAWQKRVYGLSAQSSAGGFATLAFTPDQLAAFMGVDGVRVSKEVYNTGGAAITTIGTVLDTTLGTTGLVICFNGQGGASTDDPSSIKRFVSPTTAGDFKVYLQQMSAKIWDLTVEHYSNIVITSSTAIQKLTIS